MRLMIAALIAMVLAWPAMPETRVPRSQSEVTLSYAPVVRAAAPAVVNIYARRIVAERRSPFAGDPFFGPLFRDHGQLVPRVQNALGSGVILRPDGLVVSNYHVVGDASDIRVVLNDRREFGAEVILADEASDLAVLRLEGADELPALPLRDGPPLEVGDLVLAIGNPFGVGQTVSGGIVSGLARSGLSLGSGRGYFIQTDAAINPGNSGGALVDMQGRLVGVNTAILTRSGGSQGVGFAVPSDLVARVVEQAEAGQDSFLRPWAGMTGQAVDAALAESFGMERPLGVVVAELHRQSPFRAAGLRPGDIVTEVDGDEVNTPPELLYRLSVARLGREVEVDYLREGRMQSTRVALMVAPETPPRGTFAVPAGQALRGLVVENVSPALIAEMGLPLAAEGVVVVAASELAARVGLRRGDILLAINGVTIERTEDVARALAGRERFWQVEYLRDGRRRSVQFRY
ncbi:trypsin-like peptidase domain-containing protein [Alkalilacustris brevis]|uniref:trypsin-like peptidase domain-containing protein n=1 Tax=Alkalilacustris brevis TaxID=2026338 RepID=UPI000E0D986E|nr:trypsin-like peptidase domain-containing protein [Alkalilacustris brevis]